MAHKTIRHVLTHWARETSLASCLAARDNRLPVLVPVEGERRLCSTCVCIYTTDYMCECEEREGPVSLGAVQQ